MKKIGVLFGIELSFPYSLIDRINKKKKGVKADVIKLGAVKNTEILKYDVIFDRVSDQVPYFSTILKSALLQKIKVVNNPFWNCADNNFFHAVLAEKLGIRVPKTVYLPSKELPEGTVSETMTNLIYPLNWAEVFDYVGFPAYIKPNLGHSTYNTYKIYNETEFFSAYDLTGKKTMILQESIEFEEYYRCFVIAKKHVRIIKYDPHKPLHMRYSKECLSEKSKMFKNLEQICIKICEALDFDFNSIEFAIRDGIPYAVDFLNPTPNADKEYLLEESFEWVVEHTANLLIELANQKNEITVGYDWNQLLGLSHVDEPIVEIVEEVVKKPIKKKTVKE